MSIELDETTHTYINDGRPVDGLTNTIKEAGLVIPGDINRGQALHLATEYYDRGTLDESSVDPQIKGYLESWKKLRQDLNYTPIEIEYKIYNPILMVASKVDRIPLLDMKAGVPQPWHILQIAFQWATLITDHPREWISKPMDVYLDENGASPKVKVYSMNELKEAYKVYCAMLTYLRWRREKYGSTSTVNNT